MEGYPEFTEICNNPTPRVTFSRTTTIDTESIDTNATPQTSLIKSGVKHIAYQDLFIHPYVSYLS